VADWRTGLTRRAWRSLISIGACLLIGTLACSAPAGAQDASWLATPTVVGPLAGTFDFNANANWNPATAPGSVTNTGTATFGVSTGTSINFSSNTTTLGGLTFNPGASSYTFSTSNSQTITLNGAGINGGSASTINFTNTGILDFANAATAGGATINTSHSLVFDNTSTAGTAAINNTGGVSFDTNSTAGSASIANSNVVAFNASSTAGSATITNNGFIGFGFGNSSTTFVGTSTAGNATINNNIGSTIFQNSSTAGSATITNISSSGVTLFEGNSTAGNARLINNAPGATTDFSASTGLNNDNRLSAGSIEGGGSFFLGANQLTVGGNNLSTTVSGVISDCGSGSCQATKPLFLLPSTGGSLVKIGSGTLTLSGANTYTGGTTINAGLINFNSAASFGTGQIALDGGGLQWATDTTTDISSRLAAIGSNGGSFDTNGNNVTFGTGLSGSGGVTKTGLGTLTFSVANSYMGGTTVNAGLINFKSAANFGTGQITLNGGGLQWATGTTTDISSHLAAIGSNGGSFDTNGNNVTFGTGLSGSGGVTKTGLGTLTFSVANSYMGGTTVNAGLINFNSAASFSTGPIALNGGGLQWANGTTTDISSHLAAIGSNGGSFDTNGNNVIFGAALTGSGSVTKTGLGTLTFSVANNYTSATAVNAGTLQGGAANVFAAASSTTINSGGTLDLGGFAQTINHVSLAGGTLQNGSLTGAVGSAGGTINGLGGAASLTTTAGTTILTGTNSYIGATTVNGGVLDVLGSITGTSQVVVNSGGMLTGSGTIDPLIVTINSGSMFAPGNGTPGTSTNIVGSLALASGALYVVQVNPATASFANISGTATLGGASVNAIFANGSYVAKQYTILTAGSISGTFNPSVVNTNLPSAFKTSLSYDSTHALLDLALVFSTPAGLNRNQQAVGNALSNYFATQGVIPTAFGALTSSGLTQISGATATGSQQATFNAMGLFLGTMTDPFLEGRGRAGAQSTGATAFAAASAYAANDPNRAYAMLAGEPVQAYEPRWSVWGAGIGGSQSTDGNASVGSNNTTSNIAGTAVGADYLISPNTLVGFALAGGGTGFSVANGGSGHSDLFQAGAYARQSLGAAYLSAALAYGWQNITTNRTVAAAGLDQLRAQFNANAFAGRAEGGYRFVAPFTDGFGITPYTAAQFTMFDLPGYAEHAIVGANNFALAYGAKNVNDPRSELGFRTDTSWALADGILTMRGRFAWAHDFNPDRSIAATFQSLPGASFVVSGAAQAANSALATASVETKWKNGWSAVMTFEGEFSAVTQSYAGKGVVRYQW
jgi:autotransporter-associated beta strand protein